MLFKCGDIDGKIVKPSFIVIRGRIFLLEKMSQVDSAENSVLAVEAHCVKALSTKKSVHIEMQ